MRTTGVMACISNHFARQGIKVPENFTATAVRTVASTSIQRANDHLPNKVLRKLFLHSESVQYASYKGRERTDKIHEYKRLVSAAVPFGNQLFQFDAESDEDEEPLDEPVGMKRRRNEGHSAANAKKAKIEYVQKKTKKQTKMNSEEKEKLKSSLFEGNANRL